MDSKDKFFDLSVVQTDLNFSTFDKGFEKITSLQFGSLIPILCEEVLPNSKVQLSIQERLYFSPVVSVLLSSLKVDFHYFFVSNRSISGYFDTFITRSQNGQMLNESELNVINAPSFRGNLVSFIDVPLDLTFGVDTSQYVAQDFLVSGTFDDIDRSISTIRTRLDSFVSIVSDSGTVHKWNYNSFLHTNNELSLISYLYDTGNIGITDDNGNYKTYCNLPFYANPINLLPLKAYWRIWFDYYRDENLDLLVDADYSNYNLSYLFEDWFRSTDFHNGFKSSIFSNIRVPNNLAVNDVVSDLTGQSLFDCAQRSYKKDYFTSALPFQQKGEQVKLSFNVIGGLPVVFSTSANLTGDNMAVVSGSYTAGSPVDVQLGSDAELLAKINIDNIPLIDIAQLRAADSFQRALENMARVGTRYNEFLLGLFGTAPSDGSLNRAKFLGGVSQRVVTSDIFSSMSPTDAHLTEFNPLGTRSSMLDSAGDSFVFNEEFNDYGWIIGLVSVMPQAYYLQGINKKFLRTTSWDYYSPYLENLSEQPILEEEIYLKGALNFNAPTGTFEPNTNDVIVEDGKIVGQAPQIFGYQERWSEYKVNDNKIGGNFRTNYQFMHQARIFNFAPDLNKDFIHTKKDGGSIRPFVDQNIGDNPPIWLDIYHDLIVNMPMSYHSVPKLN